MATRWPEIIDDKEKLERALKITFDQELSSLITPDIEGDL